MRVEVVPGIWVGDAHDYCDEILAKHPMPILSCARDPWWASKAKVMQDPGDAIDSGGRCSLHLVDGRKTTDINKRAIDLGLQWIERQRARGNATLVHCNKGRSRSPSIVLLYLTSNGLWKPVTEWNWVGEFQTLYPAYAPGPGMVGFIEHYWTEYIGPKIGGIY